MSGRTIAKFEKQQKKEEKFYGKQVYPARIKAPDIFEVTDTFRNPKDNLAAEADITMFLKNKGIFS